MNYTQFKKLVTVSREDVYLEALAENRASIRVKNEKKVVKNLEKIFATTLEISNTKGFQAMSMRDLSRESQMSMGALYAYFASKEDLLRMLQNQRRTLVARILKSEIDKDKDPAEQLKTAIRTHLYLSESMQPWFYFSFMEAKNLNRKEKQKSVEADLYTENLFKKILDRGRNKKVFCDRNTGLAAGMIKAMLQNWYLKRARFRSRRVSVDRYSQCVIDFAEAYMGA